jgi:hypothetical protein
MPATWELTNGTTVDYYSCAETAQLLRAALKQSFPLVKFSVRSKIYSGGASIQVCWTDGPTTDSVKRITGRFEGADFDGMIDLKGNKRQVLNGKPVQYGADFIFVERSFSPQAQALVDARTQQNESYFGNGWRARCQAEQEFDFTRVLTGGKPLFRPAY